MEVTALHKINAYSFLLLLAQHQAHYQIACLRTIYTNRLIFPKHEYKISHLSLYIMIHLTARNTLSKLLFTKDLRQ